MPESRVVLVTGGARGIGRGLVEHLAGAGWRVVFCDLDQDPGQRLQQRLGDTVRYVQADVSREPEVRNLVAEAIAAFGRLDAVINNAGLAGPHTGPVEALDLATWQRRLDVNLTGPFLVTKHAVPHLRRSGGAIVNIASTRALQSEPNSEAYAATKGGLVALTTNCEMGL